MEPGESFAKRERGGLAGKTSRGSRELEKKREKKCFFLGYREERVVLNCLRSSFLREMSS